MKKSIVFLLILSCLFGMVGCVLNEADRSEKETVGTHEPHLGIREARIKNNEDGTWELDGITYQYRLEISGRMPNASADTTFVYLSNLETITFEQAWKSSGYSSNTADYFAVEDAVFVEVITH